MQHKFMEKYQSTSYHRKPRLQCRKEGEWKSVLRVWSEVLTVSLCIPYGGLEPFINVCLGVCKSLVSMMPGNTTQSRAELAWVQMHLEIRQSIFAKCKLPKWCLVFRKYWSSSPLLITGPAGYRGTKC